MAAPIHISLQQRLPRFACADVVATKHGSARPLTAYVVNMSGALRDWISKTSARALSEGSRFVFQSCSAPLMIDIKD